MSDGAQAEFLRSVAADASLGRLARALALAEGAALHLLEVETPRTLQAALPVLRGGAQEVELEVVSRPFEALRSRDDVVAEVLATLSIVRADGAVLVLDASTAMRDERDAWAWLFHRWNEGRERWLGARRTPVVLALPPWLARLLAEEAPDLWSVRGPGARVTIGPPPAIPLLDRQGLSLRWFDRPRATTSALEALVAEAREARGADDHEESRLRLAEALVALGERNRQREALDDATRCWTEALQIGQGTYAGRAMLRGWTVMIAATQGLAETLCVRGEAMAPEAVEAAELAARLTAIEFVPAEARAPLRGIAFAIKLRALAGVGRFDEAAALLGELAAITPIAPDVTRASIAPLKELLTAEFHLDRGDFGRAIAHAATVLAGQPAPSDLVWAALLSSRAQAERVTSLTLARQATAALRAIAPLVDHVTFEDVFAADRLLGALILGAEAARRVGDEETCGLLTDAATRTLPHAVAADPERPRLLRLRLRLAALSAADGKHVGTTDDARER